MSKVNMTVFLNFCHDSTTWVVSFPTPVNLFNIKTTSNLTTSIQNFMPPFHEPLRTTIKALSFFIKGLTTTNGTSHSSKLCGFKLTATSIHLLPQWFELLSGIMANKQILDVINLNMIQAGTANGLDLVAASAADGTLCNKTTHRAAMPDNAPVLYNRFTNTAQTFPGTLSKQFNASRLIHLNVKSSFASTLPRTNFAYDTIKHIHGLYLAHTANPAVINKKLQAWMNLLKSS
ncbi:hypothetical protein HDU80_009405 [Chytriomyces hyalinus]|nr:hypothetical protein HDU80_009405 [Chytriomyces hyalinus]